MMIKNSRLLSTILAILFAFNPVSMNVAFSEEIICEGNLNNDGKVDRMDVILWSIFGIAAPDMVQNTPWPILEIIAPNMAKNDDQLSGILNTLGNLLTLDINGDGVTNYVDLQILIDNVGCDSTSSVLIKEVDSIDDGQLPNQQLYDLFLDLAGSIEAWEMGELSDEEFAWEYKQTSENLSYVLSELSEIENGFATPFGKIRATMTRDPEFAAKADQHADLESKDIFEAGEGNSLKLPPIAAQDSKLARAGDLLSVLHAGADPMNTVDILGKEIPSGTMGGSGFGAAGDKVDEGALPSLPIPGAGTENTEAENAGAPADKGAGFDGGFGLGNLDSNAGPEGSGRDALLTDGLTSGVPEGDSNSGNEPPGFGAQTGPQRGSPAAGMMDGRGSGPQNWHMQSSSSDTQNSNGGQTIIQKITGTNLDTGNTITDVSTHQSNGQGNVTETNEVTVQDADGNVIAHEKTTTTTDAEGNSTTTTESDTADGKKKNDVTHQMEPGAGAYPSMDVIRKIFGDGAGPRDEESNPNPDQGCSILNLFIWHLLCCPKSKNWIVQ